MVRATYALMVSFLAVAVLLLLLGSEFLFAITFLMMIGEMMIMVMFMVAFMNEPGRPQSHDHGPPAEAGGGRRAVGVRAALGRHPDRRLPRNAAAPRRRT